MRYTINNDHFETDAAIIKSNGTHHVLYRNDVFFSGDLGRCFEFVQTLPSIQIEREKSDLENLWNFDWDELEEVLS